MGKAFFQDLEIEYFEDVYEPKEDSFLLAKAVQVEQGQEILDLGCGAGLVSIVAAKQGAKVTAVDVNKSALDNVEHLIFHNSYKKGGDHDDTLLNFFHSCTFYGTSFCYEKSQHTRTICSNR